MDPKTGLYSKAAKLIRQYPDEQASAEDMIGFARNKGARPVEIERMNPLPTGPMGREELARMFEQNVPVVRAFQYGANPRYVSPQEGSDYNWMSNRQARGETLTPEEKARFDELHKRQAFRPNIVDQYDEDTGEEEFLGRQYEDYTLPGGTKYRERLLTLGDSYMTEVDRAKQDYERAKQNHDFYAPRYENDPDNPMMVQHRQRLQDAENRLRELRGRNSQPENYISSHWRDHPNVLAHIRMSDRDVGPTSSFFEAKQWVMPVMQKIADHMGTTPADLGSGAAKYAVQNGLITPEEAATLTEIKNWQNEFTGKKGLGKRLLHVEELQSDWGQEGRKEGFNTGAAKKAYQDYVEDMRARMRQNLLDQGLPEDVARPLYQKAEPWHLAKYHGEEDKLSQLRDAWIDESGKVPTGPYVTNTDHWTDLALKNVLREAAAGNYDGVVFTPGQAQFDRYPDGEEDEQEKRLHGMKAYYDKRVPENVTKLARMHDPAAAPAEPVDLGGGYQGFHLPMTDKLRQSILNEGFPAMRLGGRVDAALEITRRFTKNGKGATLRLGVKE